MLNVEPQMAASPAAAPARRERSLYLLALLVFLASAAITVWQCRSMAGGMEMAGGWTMSMVWMRMPGQSWAAAWAMFLGMWVAMMVAMMLPSALPMLMIYRRAALFRGDPGAGVGTVLVGAGYFTTWAAFGAIAYACGVTVAAAAMRWVAVSRAVPVASGAALIVAGVYQLTPWKFACLRHCRDPLSVVAGHLHGGPLGALRLGLHHGTYCAACCWALMLVQLALGVMSIPVMAAVAIVIALEKLTPWGRAISSVFGAAVILLGAALFVQAAQS